MKAILEALRQGEKTLRFRFTGGRPIVLGRTNQADWVVPAEKFLSRRHVELSLEGEKLKVKSLDGAINPVFHNGQKKKVFNVEPGGHFVVGKTRFLFSTLNGKREERSPSLKISISPREIYQPGGVSDRLRILDLMELPEILRMKSGNASFEHVAGLIRSVTGATWVEVINAGGRVLGSDAAVDEGEFRSSQKLMAEALKMAPQPVLYCWKNPREGLEATLQEGIDWAVCAASQIHGEEPILFYAAGRGTDEQLMKDNCRLVGLIADMVGRSLSVQRLEGLKERLERFFSGQVVSKIMESSDLKGLEPKLTEGTVMFFDIRGFSKITEGKAEKILGKADELQEVMTAMTEEIFQENGVVLLFMGDGILACWNLPFHSKDHVNQACRAALSMVASLEKVAPEWRCGIGIHTGEVVAGSMGARQLFSYTVMGPVVNQASRLEGITKTVEVPILVSREVAEKISKETATTRRVGCFRPAGMNTALDLFEVRPLDADTSKDKMFALGLKTFENGQWEEAYEMLDHLPPGDRPARYIKTLAEMHRRRPPKDWKGIIELSEK